MLNKRDAKSDVYLHVPNKGGATFLQSIKFQFRGRKENLSLVFCTQSFSCLAIFIFSINFFVAVNQHTDQPELQKNDDDVHHDL